MLSESVESHHQGATNGRNGAYLGDGRIQLASFLSAVTASFSRLTTNTSEYRKKTTPAEIENPPRPAKTTKAMGRDQEAHRLH
jgi:hypothetical protein